MSPARRSLLVLAALALVLLPAAVSGDHATEEAKPPKQASSSPALEPSVLVLVGIGLVGVAIFRQRSRTER